MMTPENETEIEIVFFRDNDGSVPALDWYNQLPRKVRQKFRSRIERLREIGLRMDRPYSGYLRDSIRELRVRWQNVNYRMLYFVYHHTVGILSHGLTKERRVSPNEIERAKRNREKYLQNPERHSKEVHL
ncbi:MAG: type II toxin-antitoxin system RelE/ParE family toxin [Candidatus Poribacteria bacterium]|nr:type II toxin-antitoxin system RelE/ParE family toxin [Candidatus Poribacteria bacterium]